MSSMSPTSSPAHAEVTVSSVVNDNRSQPRPPTPANVLDVADDFSIISQHDVPSETLYLFGRTCREKETWYARLRAASLGIPLLWTPQLVSSMWILSPRFGWVLRVDHQCQPSVCFLLITPHIICIIFSVATMPYELCDWCRMTLNALAWSVANLAKAELSSSSISVTAAVGFPLSCFQWAAVIKWVKRLSLWKGQRVESEARRTLWW